MARTQPPPAHNLVWEIPEHLGKFKWSHATKSLQGRRGCGIIKTETKGVCSECILKGFAFYAKEFYSLCLLFKCK